MWVDLALFLVERDDSRRCSVLWGEGVIVATPPKLGSGSERLSDGIEVFRVATTLAVARQTLCSPLWKRPPPPGSTTGQQLLLGLVERPVLLLAAGGEHFPADRGEVVALHQFVRTDKASVLHEDRLTARALRARNAEILDALSRTTGRAFRDRDAASLGNVHLLARAGTGAVLGWRTMPASERRKPRVEAAVDVNADAVVGGSLTINIRLRGTDGGHATILDRVVVWRRGDSATIHVTANQGIGGVHVRAWDEHGVLVFDQDAPLVLEIATRMELVGATYHLDDRLTELVRSSTQAGSRDLAVRVAEVRTVSHGSTSVAGAGQREPWRQAARSARSAMLPLVRPALGKAEYFARGAEGRGTAVLELVDRISRSNKAYLVDPFFDEVGAAALLPRIRSDVELTVFTSLPDDDQNLYAALVHYLRGIEGVLLRPRVRILRVVKGQQRQAFHDRYVITFGAEGAPTGYMLSNSISGAASQHSLIITPMSAGLVGQLLEDLEDLLEPRDDASREQLWPPPKPARRTVHQDRYGFGWMAYLERLVPRLGRRKEAWLLAAKRSGVLSTGDDGPSWASTKSTPWILSRLLPDGRLRLRAYERLDLGDLVAAIGERVARGLDLAAEDVAAHIGPHAWPQLDRFLRRSFTLPSDLSAPFPDASRTKMALRQLMRRSPLETSEIECALGLWSNTEVRSRSPQRGRRFVYRVFALAEPVRCLEVAFDLADPEVFGALLDYGAFRSEWPRALTDACLRSTCPTFRALGCQSLARPHDRGDFSPMPEAPDANVVAGIRDAMQSAGVPPADRAAYAAIWATGRRESLPVGDGLLDEVIAGLGAVDDDAAHAIAKRILTRASTVTELVARAIDVGADLACARVVVAFCRAITELASKEDAHVFEGDVERCAAVATAVQYVAQRRGVSLRGLVTDATRRDELRAATSSLTPWRHRSGYRAARFALGMSILLEALAVLLVQEGRAECLADIGTFLERSSEAENDLVAALERAAVALRGDAAVPVQATHDL